MDAVLILASIVIAVFGLASFSLTLGVDSRDGFADDRLGVSHR